MFDLDGGMMRGGVRGNTSKCLLSINRKVKDERLRPKLSVFPRRSLFFFSPPDKDESGLRTR